MITSRLFFMWNYSGPCSSSVFVLGDAVASVGRLAFSFTDRRNSSLCKKLYVTFPSDTTGRSFRKSQTTDRSDRAPEHEGTFYFLSILFFKIDRIAIPKFFVSLDILVINPAFNNCRRSSVYTGSDILHRPFYLFPLFFIGIFHLDTT